MANETRRSFTKKAGQMDVVRRERNVEMEKWQEQLKRIRRSFAAKRRIADGEGA